MSFFLPIKSPNGKALSSCQWQFILKYTELSAPDVLFLSLSSDAGEKRNAFSCYSFETIERPKEFSCYQRKVRFSGKND